MGYFAQLGKPLAAGQAILVNGGLTATLITAFAGAWIDLYSIVISTDETAGQTVTITDGTTTLTYYVGGAVPNPPLLDQGSIPVRFAKATNITCASGAVTAGKHISVMIRGLVSKT